MPISSWIFLGEIFVIITAILILEVISQLRFAKSIRNKEKELELFDIPFFPD